MRLTARAVAAAADDRIRAFDFTEGDGVHKAQFGCASVDCADVLVLQPTLRNRAALGRWGLRARAWGLLRR